nr:MAG TPA: hypothetical protein [Caudoviricetes sp.]
MEGVALSLCGALPVVLCYTISVIRKESTSG